MLWKPRRISAATTESYFLFQHNNVGVCKSFEFIVLKYSSVLYISSIMQQFFCIKFHNKKNKNKVKKNNGKKVLLILSSVVGLQTGLV